MAAPSNQGAAVQWFRSPQANGTVRHRLCVDGAATPYFVDDARKAGRWHRVSGEPVGLFGSGMHASGCAMTLGGFRNVGIAKARAETMALGER